MSHRNAIKTTEFIGEIIGKLNWLSLINAF